MIGIVVTFLLLIVGRVVNKNYSQIRNLKRESEFLPRVKRTFSLKILSFFLRNRIIRTTSFFHYCAIFWFFIPSIVSYFFLPSLGDIDGITEKNGSYYYYEISCDVEYDQYGRDKDCYVNTFGPPLSQSDINRFNEIVEKRDSNWKEFEYYFSNPYNKIPEGFFSGLTYWVVYLLPIGLLLWITASPVFEKLDNLCNSSNPRAPQREIYLKILHARVYYSTLQEIQKLPYNTKSKIYQLLQEYYDTEFPEFSILKV